ncbi:metallo-beta-lactamase superfamily protein, putative [Alloactinosynnema sp. L-07]|uniref:MBL fold metallo-hydrolase n=1 Tax=Alloactinosynnema sp. L-07 TaxID=1653480 RepID=UPI00065F092E|nr:MBL fold metallo-hydrolase [Alloactinosynnema sp. L-07]CRK57114.1 metallo-beta-lactamase superfamily protein, putative [Alloactinosynnema sp. L-07]
MRISERLTMVRFGVSQAYLWRDGDELTLIDAGQAGDDAAIAAAVRGLGLSTESVRRVVLTHGHNDHAGGAAAVRAWHGASVLAHQADAPLVRGLVGPPEPVLAEWERPLFESVVPGVAAAPPCVVDVELAGGEVLDFGGGARVIPVAGHTPGSVAIHLPEHGVLFCGDTVAEFEGRVLLGVFNADPDQARESFRVQAALDVDTACFGHGDPVIGNAGAALRAAAG